MSLTEDGGRMTFLGMDGVRHRTLIISSTDTAKDKCIAIFDTAFVKHTIGHI